MMPSAFQTRSEFAFELGEPFRESWIFGVWGAALSPPGFHGTLQIRVDKSAQPCRRGETQARERIEESIRLFPTPDSTRSYRYTGPVDGHFHGDRYLEVGEVVTLIEDQASAWRDRFEPADARITSEEPITAS